MHFLQLSAIPTFDMQIQHASMHSFREVEFPARSAEILLFL